MVANPPRIIPVNKLTIAGVLNIINTKMIKGIISKPSDILNELLKSLTLIFST